MHPEPNPQEPPTTPPHTAESETDDEQEVDGTTLDAEAEEELLRRLRALGYVE
jgi:hypothetical protein